MSGKKKLLMALLILVVLLSVILGLCWSWRNYILVDRQFYPKGAQQLDLREQEISIRHYERLRRRIPGCEIFWNVPFQGNALPWDTREISVSALTEKDIRILEYFEQLEQVDAEGCTDYANLLQLQKQRPELKVNYSVLLGGERYAAGVKRVDLRQIGPEDVALLQYLPNLEEVLCSGGDEETIAQLQAYCRDNQLEFLISLGDAVVSPDTESVTAEGINEEQLNLLQFLPEMKRLSLRNPRASAESLLRLRQERPDLELTWEQEICGQVFASGETEIDLSSVQITDLKLLDEKLAYFPDAGLVFLGECGLDNELLADHREKVRDRYKLVWTVSCGSKLKTRTDATTFMPVREQVYYFNDEEAYNLRYCEDMVCIDIGHMSIYNIDFVKFMPNLQYLILAHTQVQYIEPIAQCKKLKFLELDWSPVRDLTPLKGCTALEDLNLGNTFADFTPVGEMTWLKNLWMIDCSTRSRYLMTQALPDTKVMVTGAATVANGWRQLDNYYKMRDLLGMHYMSW